MNHNPNPVHTFVFVSVSSSLPVMCPVTCTQRAELKSLDEHHRLLPNCAPCSRVFTGATEKHMCVCVRLCIVLLSVCLVPCFHPMTLCTLFCLWTSKNVGPNKNRLTPHPAACFEQKKKKNDLTSVTHLPSSCRVTRTSLAFLHDAKQTDVFKHRCASSANY